MDENERDRLEFEQLLKRFRDSLANPASDDYFSEDDLLDIIDYAGDVENDYLRTEALFRGARYFPDSEALRARRGLLYHDLFSDNDIEMYTNDTSANKDFLSGLIRISSGKDSGSVQLKKLEQLIHKTSSLDNEEVIRLVNFLEDINRLDWLYANLDELKVKADSTTSLLYEIAAASVDAHDYERAAELAVKLTDDEPYNVDFWTLRALALSGMLDATGSLDAAEIALAIKPDQTDAQLAKAQALQMLRREDELIELYNQYPDNERLAEVVADIAAHTYDASTYDADFKLTPQDVALLKNLVRRFPANRYIIIRLAESVCDDEAIALIANCCRNGETEPDEHSVQYFVDMANEAISLNNIVSADNLMRGLRKAFRSNSYLLLNNVGLMAELAYRNHRYLEAVRLVGDFNEYNHGTTPTMMGIHVLSLIGIGAQYDAVQLAEQILQGKYPYKFLSESANRVDVRLGSMGLSILMTDILERARTSGNGRSLPPDYNPLKL